MRFKICPAICRKNEALPLAPQGAGIAGHILLEPMRPYGLSLPTGSCLAGEGGEPIFKIVGHAWLGNGEFAVDCPILEAMLTIGENAGPANLENLKTGYSIAITTLSDKGAQGLRRDESGPLAAKMMAENLPICHSRNFLLDDDPARLRALLADLALAQQYDVVLTTGGTGLSKRDLTPQATEKLIDIPLHGFVQTMLAASLRHTPNAAISRACAGLIGKCLVINLPGSLKAVRENLEAIMPALPHALKKIHGDTSDCGA